jgi:hypothetical protein
LRVEQVMMAIVGTSGAALAAGAGVGVTETAGPEAVGASEDLMTGGASGASAAAVVLGASEDFMAVGTPGVSVTVP